MPGLGPRSHEFACHSKACAPPPAGKGGSLRSQGSKASRVYIRSGASVSPHPVGRYDDDPRAAIVNPVNRKAVSYVNGRLVDKVHGRVSLQDYIGYGDRTFNPPKPYGDGREITKWNWKM